jgi:hypothetical protein
MLDHSRGALQMELSASRFIAIELSEEEWQALRAIQPDPASWMKQQVRELLERAGDSTELASAGSISAAGRSAIG